MRNIIMRWIYQRQPSRRITRIVEAVLANLGIGQEYLVDDFALSVGREMRGDTVLRAEHYARVNELIAANNVDVERRRKAEQAMRGMLAYAEQYATDTHAALKAIVSANAIEL